MRLKSKIKNHKIRVLPSQVELKNVGLLYGVYGLRSCTGMRLTEKQIEALRRTAKKYLKKSGKLWMMVKATRGVTRKPSEVRMGKGKGGVDHKVVVVKKGMILLELGGINLNEKLANVILKYVGDKSPMRTEVVKYRG